MPIKWRVYSIEHYGIYTRPLTVKLVISEGGKSRVSMKETSRYDWLPHEFFPYENFTCF